jgi:hypothetical protein
MKQTNKQTNKQTTEKKQINQLNQTKQPINSTHIQTIQSTQLKSNQIKSNQLNSNPIKSNQFNQLNSNPIKSKSKSKSLQNNLQSDGMRAKKPGSKEIQLFALHMLARFAAD